MSSMPLNGPFPLLSLLIWLPILGGALCMLLGNGRPQAARWVALATALVGLALSIPLLTGFDMTTAGMQFVEQRVWVSTFDIRYHLGVDGISVPLIALTTLTTVLVWLFAAVFVSGRVKSYAEGVDAATKSIDSGQAKAILDRLKLAYAKPRKAKA